MSHEKKVIFGAEQLHNDEVDAHGNKYRWTEYRDVPSAARVIDHPPDFSEGHSIIESSTRAHHQDATLPAVSSATATQHCSDVHGFMEPTSAIPARLKYDNPQLWQALRRSQSEGPHPYRNINDIHHYHPAFKQQTGVMATWVGRRRHITEQQRPDHWLVSAPAVDSRASAVHQEQSFKRTVGQPKPSENHLQFPWPAGKSSYDNRRMPESVDSLLHGPSEVVEKEMVGLLGGGQHKHGGRHRDEALRPADELQPTDETDQPRRRRYKTEYKKKFRPFSLYQYVDGRFQKQASESKQAGCNPPATSTTTNDNCPETKDTWYREVLELRKKAGEYKYRGLGGELMPQHMADLYAKQFDVWEQVSRRSSLSALSLAATSPRPSSVGSRDGKSTGSSSKRESPAKSLPPTSASSRPGYAQSVLNSSRKDNNRNKGDNKDETEQPARREMNQQRSIEGKVPRAKSAKRVRSPSRGPSTAAAGNVALAIRPSLGAIFHPMGKASARSASAGPERRMPKSTSSTSTAARTTPAKAATENNNGGAAPVKVSKPREKVPAAENKENDVKEAAVAHDNGPVSLPVPLVPEPTRIDPVSSLPVSLVKALAEPTRVKSPDASMVRSPDPVNWTVPLDTGKTFTVTQNIRGGEGSRPQSVSMTVRPPPTNAPAAPAVSANTSEVSGQSPAPSTAAPSPAVGAPGTPPHDSLGYFSEPEIIIDYNSAHTDFSQGGAIDALPAIHSPPADQGNYLNAPEPVVDTNCENDVHKGKEANGVASLPEVPNEKKNGRLTEVTNDPLREEPVANVPLAPSIVPGTTLRRLEDPTPFHFSRPGTLESLNQQPTVAAAVPEVPAPPKAPRYRVLEAPGLDEPLAKDMPASTSMTFSSPYKVLQDPSTPTSGLTSSPSSNRSLASDVLEQARTRFDRFWTKKDGEK